METNHEAYVKRAIIMARRGAGFVETNPMVGAVLVDRGNIIAESFHARFGGPHAERRLLEHLPRSVSRAVLHRATLYLTLEPCSHLGKKTPPCLDLVKNSGLRHVVIGSVDPNPKEGGRSITALRRAGLCVTVGVAQTDCDYLIRTFRKWIRTRQPYVLAKVGMSADGKITSPQYKQYITNAPALERVHELRQEFSAIMVGVNTIIHDNPRLDTRLSRRRVHHPIKVILDSRLRIPATSRCLDDRTIIACLASASDRRKRQLVRTGAELLEVPAYRLPDRQLFDQIDVRALLTELGRREISSVLLEGGSFVFTTFINSRAIDEFNIFVAPELYGATHLPFTYALQYTVTLKDPRFEILQDNVLMRGYASYQKTTDTVPNHP